MRRQATEAIDIRFWGKIVAALILVLMGMVWEHVEALNLEKELKDLHREAGQLSYDNGRLQMQIHQWISPSHLESIARKDYGMIPLDSSHVIGLSK
jgi:cell division protein FtsL